MIYKGVASVIVMLQRPTLGEAFLFYSWSETSHAQETCWSALTKTQIAQRMLIFISCGSVLPQDYCLLKSQICFPV